ncbi:intraflagellar transport protein 74 homolog [Onthophagus taurus]|uniref:intraflagellar transport protein 74 homolog n=1 Tax=Onthophagus taurus TaxID=166361 RepID=UPI0039BDD901
MERELSGRASSTRPPSGISMPRTASVMSRPLTQQGLTGLKPSTAGGQRIYKDNRFYLSKLQSQNTSLRDEIARLKKLTDENKMKTLNLDDLHKQAQEAAKRIEEKQELLSAYNIALEMHISKTKEDEILGEIEKMKRDNDLKMKELDGVLTKKIQMQEKIDRMEKEQVRKENAIKELIELLPEQQKEEFFDLQRQHEKVLNEIQELQDEIKKEKDENDKYKTIISESPELQERFKLIQTIRNLEHQEEELQNFLSNTQTPAQQRETLLQQVKQDKADIETLQKLLETLEQEIVQMEEKIAEINKELENKDSARLKKHKELREREAHMDAFIETYDEKVSTAKEKLTQANDTVIYLLDQMVENLAEFNIEEFGMTQIDSNDQSLEGWNKRCGAFQEQIAKLTRFSENFESESNRIEAKKAEMLKEIEKMSDIEKCKEEMARECTLLEDQNQLLQAKLESTKAALNEGLRRKDEIEKKLEDNPTYHDVVEIQKKIEELESKKMEIESTIEAEKKDTSLEDVINGVRALMKERNEQLINELKNKINK